MWSPKSVNKIVLCIETQTDGKFWLPIFLIRIRTRRSIWNPNGDFSTNEYTLMQTCWLFIYLALKNHNKRIKWCPYTQFCVTAKCFKSATLRLFLSLPFQEEMYPIEKLLFDSLLYVQNGLSFWALSRRLTDHHVARTGHKHAAFLIPVPWTVHNTRMYVMGNMAAKLRHVSHVSLW